jgi:hypothetical protein
MPDVRDSSFFHPSKKFSKVTLYMQLNARPLLVARANQEQVLFNVLSMYSNQVIDGW